MSAFQFMIDGVDIRHFIAEKGIKWQRNDVDGPNSGRALGSADMIRDRVAIKGRLDVTCRPLTFQEAKTLQNLIVPVFVTVQYTDLLYGDISGVFYSNNGSATYDSVLDGEDVDTMLIEGITFPLILK